MASPELNLPSSIEFCLFSTYVLLRSNSEFSTRNSFKELAGEGVAYYETKTPSFKAL